jgi:tetratricopeptide (TPR) repeat protein
LALQFNPLSFDSRDLLTQINAGQGSPPALNAQPPPPSLKEQAAAALLTLSLQQYQAGRFEDCISSAKRALEDKPDYAEAYNNIAAAYNSMSRWDEGIQAATQAIRLKPDFQLAKNNLGWAISQKQKAAQSK